MRFLFLLAVWPIGLSYAQNCAVDPTPGLPIAVDRLESTLILGEAIPLDARQVRNLLLTLRRVDNRFVGKVGIVNGQASQMRLAILGSEAAANPDLREALTCLTRGWKEGCGLLCENEFQPITVEVLAGQGIEGWLELARAQIWGFLGANLSRAEVYGGGKTPGGVLLLESPLAGDVVLMGSLFGAGAGVNKQIPSAGGIKAPGIATVLKQLLRWEVVKAQSRPYRP